VVAGGRGARDLWGRNTEKGMAAGRGTHRRLDGWDDTMDSGSRRETRNTTGVHEQKVH
jgi:hypothetical protein